MFIEMSMSMKRKDNITYSLAWAERVPSDWFSKPPRQALKLGWRDYKLSEISPARLKANYRTLGMVFKTPNLQGETAILHGLRHELKKLNWAPLFTLHAKGRVDRHMFKQNSLFSMWPAQ